VHPVAYLCLGYACEFLAVPKLQQKGWCERVPLETLLYHNRWGTAMPDGEWLGAHLGHQDARESKTP
jgi:hypothetical protein